MERHEFSKEECSSGASLGVKKSRLQRCQARHVSLNMLSAFTRSLRCVCGSSWVCPPRPAGSSVTHLLTIRIGRCSLGTVSCWARRL